MSGGITDNKEEATMKKFIIIGNMNAITYKEIFPLIKNNELWLGCRNLGSEFYFSITESYQKEIIKEKKEGSGWKMLDGVVHGRVASACWFTNVDHKKRHEPLDLYKRYTIEDFPKYDNFCGFEVSKVCNIFIDDYIDIEIPDEDYEKWKEAYGDDLIILES